MFYYSNSEKGRGRLFFVDKEVYPSLNALVAGKIHPEFDLRFGEQKIKEPNILELSSKGRNIIKDSEGGTLKIKGAGAIPSNEILSSLADNIEKIFPDKTLGNLIEAIERKEEKSIEHCKETMSEDDSEMREKAKELIKEKKEYIRKIKRKELSSYKTKTKAGKVLGRLPASLNIEHSYGRPFGAVDPRKGHHEVKIMNKLNRKEFPTPKGEFELYPDWVQKTAREMSNLISETGNLNKVEGEIGRIKIPYEGDLITRICANIALIEEEGIEEATIEALKSTHRTFEDILNKGKTLTTGNTLGRGINDVTWSPTDHLVLLEKPNGKKLEYIDLEGFGIEETPSWRVGKSLSELTYPLFKVFKDSVKKKRETGRKLEIAKEFFEEAEIEINDLRKRNDCSYGALHNPITGEIPLNGERHLLILGKMDPGRMAVMTSDPFGRHLKGLEELINGYYGEETLDTGYEQYLF